MFPTTVALLTCALALHVSGAACPSEGSTKQLLCYVEQISAQFDPCLCTHLVLQTPLDKLSPNSELLKKARGLQESNPALKLVAVASELAETALKRRDSYAKSISNVVDKCGLDGVEIDLRWGAKVAGKVQLVDLVQSISKEFKSLEPKVRAKRDYKIYEQSSDDVTTEQWTPPKSKTKPRKIRSSDDNKESSEVTMGHRVVKKEVKPEDHVDIILRLTSEPQHLAKNYDLKRLSKYVDLYTVASDNLTDASEHGVTYHPSRLMGIQDILNADSLIDLLTGLGAPHEKLVLTLPARALRFTLQDAKKNLPQSPAAGEPKYITQSELCATMSEGNWTVERDEDLTAPYAFHDKTWIAFDDSISASIKGKYILLRDLAGGAVMSADAEDWSGKCNATKTAVLTTLYNTFTNIARKSRAAQLISLQEELHESAQYSYSGDIHLSPYRIVRVVDRAGSIHVVRKEAKTEFECSRQGYFTHPSGCNRFYRCVKFNQYTPDFTVFEYDCPAGLAFDERYEVCVWPGSLPDGGACQGSSEIAPVPRSRYVCPRVEGYYADPENCRWFFACLDHVRDGITPLTAYEFRCPFGLVFNEKALVCDWPWLVEGCGGIGAFRATFSVGDFYEGRHRASYASLSDVHVSGGRIDNVPGGVVLGSSVVGGLASGSNIHASGAGIYSGGAYAAKGYSGGAYGYSGLGEGSHNGGLYVAGEHSGGNAGLYSARGSSSGGLYLGGALENSGASGAKIALASAKGVSGYAGEYDGSSGVYGGGARGYSTFLSSGSRGSAGYSSEAGNAGGVYGGSSGGSYEAGKYGGSGASGVVYTTVGSGGSAGYLSEAGDAGGVYIGASRGPYEAGKYDGSAAAGVVYTTVGTGGSADYSREAENAGGAFVGASGGSFEAGKYGGSGAAGLVYTTVGSGGSAGHSSEAGHAGGAYVDGGLFEAGKYAGLGATGVSSGIVYSGGNQGHSVGGIGAGQYSDASKGSFSSSSFVSKTGGTSYKVGGGYSGFDEHIGAYNRGFGQKSEPVTLVSDAIVSGLSGINVLAEQKPVSLINVQSVKVTPGSDVVSGFGINHFNTYDNSVPLVTPSPLPAVSVSTYSAPVIKTVTQSPISISSYKAPVVYQPTTPRPTTYYQSPGLAVTPVRVTYQRPLASVTPELTPLSVTPTVQVHTYEQPSIKTVTPAPVPAFRLPTVLKTPVVPLNPVQYATPTPFSIGYSSFGSPHLSSPAPIEPVHISTPEPLPAVSSVHISYPKPEIGVLKSLAVPYSPVSYTFKQPVASIQLSTPAPALIKTVTEAPAVYREEYVYEKPIFPVKPALSFQPAQKIQPVLPVQPVQTVIPFQKIQPALPVQPVQPVLPIQKIQPAIPVQPVQPVLPVQKIQPVLPVGRVEPFQKIQPVQPIVPLQQPQVPAVSYTYTYNRPGLKVPISVTPSPVAVEFSPSPAPVIKPLEVKYSYPRPAVLKTPVVPLNPIQYSTLAPVTIDYTPTPGFAHSRPTVLKEPIVPLNPIQYSTPAPINFQYSTPVTGYSQSEINVEQNLPAAPAQPVNFVKAIPRPPFRAPLQYSTPAPVAIEYPTPRPIPFRPAVLKTPVVPLNPVQYTTSSPVFFEHSTPAPLKPVEYVQPNIPFAPISSVKFGTGYKLPAITQQPISIDYSYQQSIKSPITPVSIEYSSVTPAPAVHQVEVNYNYPKPAVKLVEQPVVVSTVAPAAPTVPMYQRVINAFKAPVISAYQKVLNTITGSTPSTLIQPVTQSPVSYAPVDVGFSYKRPALVKTQSIPVTPVNVVPAYQKVLNVIKASTTPAPLYANHYTSTYETPQVVVSTPKPFVVKPTVISESSFGLDFANHGFEGNTDEFYEAVRQDFGSGFASESHKGGFGGYEYQRPAVKFTEGVSLVQESVPLKSDVSYYTSTTQVPVIKEETYRTPVKTFVEYEQPAYNVEFESGKVSGHHKQSVGGLSYSQVPVVKVNVPVVRKPVQVAQDYSSGHVGVVYDGSVGYSQLPVVTSTTPAPITTARVRLPVVKTSDAYYTRRKQSRLRPVIVNSESYPTSTSTPLTIIPSTLSYTTTPVATYSSSAAYEGEELEVEGEEEDESAKLLEQYSGQFGGVLTKGVSVSGYSGESSTVANIKDGEAIVGVLKKGRVDYTGRKTKSKVVVVSRLSDFNPILVGKLGAECSCSPKSNTLSLRRGNTRLFTPKSPNLSQISDQTLTDSYVTSTSTLSPEAVVGNEFGASFYSEKVDTSPVVEIKPLAGQKEVFSTTLSPIIADYSLSSADAVPTVYQVSKLGKAIKTVYSDNSIRPAYQDVLLGNRADLVDAGKSFDRYGPGGLRGVDEVLQGSVDCKRAGLFRHPKYCNKFYACNWDEWKGRFTLHVFNCPVHLAYDSGLGACNWPSKGPACSDDNLLV